MNDRSITRNDAISIAKELGKQLPEIAPDVTLSGRTEWTQAIWRFLDCKRKEYEPAWTLYPSGEPIKGRVAGEYLVDFCLFDPKRGCRIACESEWGDIGRIDWAFDKLRSIKADLKILFFQASHTDSLVSEEVFKRIKDYLSTSHHHVPCREFYLFLQFDGSQAKSFLWEPKDFGPNGNVEIEPLD